MGALIEAASPAEVRLAEPTLGRVKVPRLNDEGRPTAGRPRTRPRHIVADKGYDSDPLRQRLARRGIHLVSPHRRNRRNYRELHPVSRERYRRRWKVERTFAWLGNFRRLVVRYEHHVAIYEAFFHVACLVVTLRFLGGQP
jgi:transposase